MPPKVSRVSTKGTATVLRGGGSSKTSGSNKSSSSSTTVKKTATTTTTQKPVQKTISPPPKPNVDKVDFGKPKPKVDAVTYKPLSQNPAMRREAEKAPREEAIMRRARQEVKAEDFARSHTGTAIGTAILALPMAIIGGQMGGVSGSVASTCASGGLVVASGVQQDKGEMTIPQRYIYNVLTDGMTIEEREFVEGNRSSIDYAKEIITQTGDIGEQ